MLVRAMATPLLSAQEFYSRPLRCNFIEKELLDGIIIIIIVTNLFPVYLSITFTRQCNVNHKYNNN